MPLVGWIRRIVAALGGFVAMAAIARAEDVNDYPTSARAEYVFGCMKANGETRQAIEQCSCSIDVIASLLPYDRYVTAETVLSMSQVRGNLGGQFRTSEQATGRAQRSPARAGRSRSAMFLDEPVGGRLVVRAHQMPESSTFHSFWKTWPSVSLASARNVFAPFDT